MKLLVAVCVDERRAEMVALRDVHGITTKHCSRARELNAKLECRNLGPTTKSPTEAAEFLI